MATLKLNGISKTWPDRSGGVTTVAQEFSASFESSKVYCFLGPNGCGKSTLLQIIAGIELPDAGTVTISTASQAKVGMVFQDYRSSLLPWMTAIENVEWPLRHLSRAGSTPATLHETIAYLDKHLDIRKPVGRLSGGQSQLVAIARAWAFDPAVLLLDEPFSALDVVRREALYDTVRAIAKHKIVILITHDIHEAVALGDCVMVFSGPPLRQVGSFEFGPVGVRSWSERQQAVASPLVKRIAELLQKGT